MPFRAQACNSFTEGLLFIITALQRTNTENWNKNSQKRNCAATFHIHVSVSVLYIHHDQSAYVFCCRKYVDRSWEYIHRSQTHECGNWGFGGSTPRTGIRLATEFCSEKIPRNRLGMDSVIPRNSVGIPRLTEEPFRSLKRNRITR
jgi:hypothetical protein